MTARTASMGQGRMGCCRAACRACRSKYRLTHVEALQGVCPSALHVPDFSEVAVLPAISSIKGCGAPSCRGGVSNDIG